MLTKTGRCGAVEKKLAEILWEFFLFFGQKTSTICWSKLRKQLGIEQAEKLVKVYRFLQSDKEILLTGI